MQKVKTAIVGASGYSGEELVFLLGKHPQVEIVALTSRQSAGKSIASVIPRLAGSEVGKKTFIEPSAEALIATGAQSIFLALPHGLAAEFAVPLREAGLQVIDLSADFRLRSTEVFAEYYGGAHPAPTLLEEAIYALPELCGHEVLKGAGLLACPGCYPTSVQIPLVPLLRNGLLKTDSIVINSLSGTSGAGRKADLALLFAECNESLRAYGVPKHRHLPEIEQQLTQAAGKPVVVSFTPHLVPVTRGIISTIIVKPAIGVGATRVIETWKEAYETSPFVRITEQLPDSKNITGTNFIDIAAREDERTGNILLFSAVDNLVKGAAGQAVQAFNVTQGWDEKTGLL